MSSLASDAPRPDTVAMEQQHSPFQLIVASKRGLEGFESTDDYPSLMDESFRRIKLDYVRPFVCASVRPIERRVDGRIFRKFNTGSLYGQEFPLKEHLISDVELVCSGDMQNIMDAAMRDNPNEDGDLSTYAQYFTVLKGMTDAEKKDAIWKAHESMSTISRRFG